MGSNNQVGVQLVFSADTTRAKNQLRDLEKTLTKITQKSAVGSEEFALTKDLAKAQKTATMLKIALKEAVDTDTGNINIEKFDKTLKMADMDAKKIKKTLVSIGPEGQKAFIDLTRSVASAEAPIKKVDSLFNKLWDTMKNTMKWQISSSVLHGMMSAFSGAFNYAKDLNESLNNIRIVSGASKEEMAQFAVEANKAARALDTTTVAYTDAALIYYQQGLKEEDVKKRADTTVQLSNISGDTVEEVSNQLTSIWNNFYDGSKSLEYYADVLTALGAATASSSDEIAGGLERFSSIADVIGLSYEYASSGLATITAITRQSEDVVGTALKTIFARIQGLKLGETLEDGTTLNKYSEALQKVGISIFNQNNQLKDMDAILDEMGEKWATLNKDQQVALAQSVAGVRQYNQLVSLMDNWDVFKENLLIAQSASGTLKYQAEIYGESWEAAAKNVKAAMQDVYDSLIDDDFFISILHSLEKIVTVLGEFIDGINGLPGLITLLGSIFFKVFNKQISGSLDSTKERTLKFINESKQAVKNGISLSQVATNQRNIRKSQITDEYLKEAQSLNLSENSSQKEELRIAANTLGFQRILAKQYDENLITKETADRLSLTIKLYREYGDIIENITKKYENQETAVDRLFKKVNSYFNKQGERGEASKQQLQDIKNLNEETNEIMNYFQGNITKDNKISKEWAEGGKDLAKNLQNFRDKFGKQFGNEKRISSSFRELEDMVALMPTRGYKEDENGMLEIPEEELQRFRENIEEVYKDLTNLKKEKIDSLVELAEKNSGQVSDNIEELREKLYSLVDIDLEKRITGINADKIYNSITDGFKKAKKEMVTFGQVASSTGEAITSLMFGIQGIKAAINAIGNDDLEGFDKFFIITTSLGTSLSGISGALFEIENLMNKIQEIQREQTIQKLGEEGLENLNNSNKNKNKKSGKKFQILDSLTFLKTKLKEFGTGVLEWGGAVFGLIKKFSPWIGGIMITVTLLTIAWKKLNSVIHEEEIAVKKASEASEQLKSSYQDVTAAHEEMIEQLSSYEKAKESLDILVEGTKDYNEALKEANTNALVLVSQLKDLNPEDYGYNENGLLEINEQALERAKALEDRKQSIVERAKSRGQIELTATQNELQEKDIRKEFGKDTSITRFSLDEQLVKLLSDNPEFLKLDIDSLAGELRKVYSPNGKESDKQYYLKLADAILKNSANLSQLNESIQGNNNLLELQNSSAAEDILSSQGYSKEDSYGKQIYSAGKRIYDQGYKEAKSEIEENYKENYEDYFQQYAEIVGLDTSLLESIKYDSSEGIVSYVDAEGEKQKISQAAISTILAEARAEEYLVSTSGQLNDKLIELNYNTGNAASEGVSDFIATKDFSEMNLEEINKIRSAIEKDADSIDEILGLTGDAVRDQEIARIYGFESVTELKNSFIKGMKEVKWEDELPVDLSSNYKKGLTQKSANRFYRVYNGLDDVNREKYLSGINAIGTQSGLNAEGLEYIDEYIHNLNWIDFESSSQMVIEQLQKMGVETSTFEDEIKSMGEALNTDLVLGETINSLEDVNSKLQELRENFATLSETAENIEIGQIISSEEYQKLINFNKELAKYFTLLADGSAMFTGDPLDYQQELLESRNNNLEKINRDLFKYKNNILKENNLKQDSETGLISPVVDKKKENNQSSVSKDQQTEGLWSEIKQTFKDFNAHYAEGAKVASEYYASIQKNKDGLENLSESSKNFDTATKNSTDSLNQLQSEINNIDKAIEDVQFERGSTNPKDSVEQEVLSFGGEYQELSSYQSLSEKDEQKKLELYSSIQGLNAGLIVQNNKEKWDEIDPKEVQEFADYLQEVNEELANNEDLAKDVARASLRLDRGIEKLASNYEEWYEILADGVDNTQESMKAFNGLRDSLSDILDVSKDNISKDYITKNLETIKRAAEGDKSAIDDLRQSLSEDLIIKIAGVNSLEELPKKFIDIHNAMKDFSINPKIDVSDAIVSLNQLLETGQITADDLIDYLGSMEIQPDWGESVVQVPQPDVVTRSIDTEVTEWETVKTPTGQKQTYPKHTVQKETVKSEPMPPRTEEHSTMGMMAKVGNKVVQHMAKNNKKALANANVRMTPQLEGLNKKPPTQPSPSSYEAGGNGGGGGGGGKDKEPTPAEKMDKTERDKIVERYYEITRAIDIMTDALSDANKVTDRLYGKKRLAAMKKEQELTKASINLLKKKKQEALNYLQSDKNKLLNNEYGINFQLDKDGNISNYTNILNGLFNQLSAAEDTYNSFGTKEEQDEYKESTLDPLNKKIEKVKELVKQYDDTNKVLMDIDNEIQDKMYEIQDRNYEIITYKVELQIEVNDMEQKKLDYFIHKYEDDFYKMAESQALLGDSFPLLTNNLATYKGEVDELTKAYNNNEISQAKYIEGLKEINDKVLDNMTSLIDLDREMLEYYNKTLDGVEDKFKKATDEVDHQLEILEHYKKTIELLNKQEDYNLVNNVLNSQFKAITNQRKAQEDYLSVLQRQERKIKSDIANSAGKEQEGYKKQLEALIPKINETENAINGLSESLAELSNEILDNDLKKLNKDFEAGVLKSLGLEDMDDYLEKIDRLKAKQEEYLTDTNKIYEINKLMRKVKQDLVKTDSEAAKVKYNEYLKSVEALGKQNRLSKYELEIAQARYQVLQAQMALEEAKNAKDAMRLVRDSSGNWNYVYTANQDKIDESQQQLEDAQNNLYNIGLQGAQDYQDKYAGVLQDFNNKRKEIMDQYRQGEIASEDEFNKRMLEIQADYQNQLKDISELYHIGHDLMVGESINKEADYIFLGITNLQDFQFATDTNLNETNNAFNRWRENSKQALGDVATNTGALTSKIEQNAQQTGQLADKIESSLLPALENELDEVRDTTEIWLSHRDALYETMEAYEDLQGHIQHTIEDAAGVKPGGILPDIPEKYKQDYSALMANYISKGNKIGDAVWNQLFAQREEKIKWLAANGYSSDYWGTSGTATKNKFEDIQAGKGDMAWYNAAKNIYSEQQIKEILRKIGISEFRTGGYTGEWGSQGKLGVLHEKELVLNEQDTKNILQSIDLTKVTDSKNNKISIVLQELISDFFSKYKDLLNKKEENIQEIQQKVSIEANFPGVSVASEIEEAFNGLVNQAAQHASQTRRQY